MNRLICFGMLALPHVSLAQEPLTLDKALQMAMSDNGTIRSARAQYLASKSSAIAARASYYPSLTPSYSYESTRLNTLTGPEQGIFNDSLSTANVTASWLLFDDGTRETTYKRSAYSRDAARETSIATVRSTLFEVHRAFYDAIRAEELLKVRRQQLDRALEVEKQAKEFADQGAGAVKDVLQATADALNARAAEITSRNQVASTRASLKAILGLRVGDELGSLVDPRDETSLQIYTTLQEAVEVGLHSRQDLAAARFRVESQRASVRLSKLNTFASWTVDVRHTRSFSPDPFESSALVFQFSVPLFDGFNRSESAKADKLTLESLRADLTQSERDAVAEIEAAFNEDRLNVERLTASRAALRAAQINYQAAFESRREGAGDLISVLTAQVSLTTAESNMIESYFDSLISNVRMRLVTGQSIPGEEE